MALSASSTSRQFAPHLLAQAKAMRAALAAGQVVTVEIHATALPVEDVKLRHGMIWAKVDVHGAGVPTWVPCERNYTLVVPGAATAVAAADATPADAARAERDAAALRHAESQFRYAQEQAASRLEALIASATRALELVRAGAPLSWSDNPYHTAGEGAAELGAYARWAATAYARWAAPGSPDA